MSGNIKLENNILTVETSTQIALFENGAITSLVSKINGRKYIETDASEVGVHIVWSGWEAKRLDTGSVECHVLSEKRAEFVYHSWYGDGVTYISADDETGDILIRPSATAGRPGVKSCAFNVRGIDKDLYALTPTCQGLKVKLDDPLYCGYGKGDAVSEPGVTYHWPLDWEIGLIIFESESKDKDGFWVHCRDDKYRQKSLSMGNAADPYRIALHSEACGPLDNNKSAGGVTWRVNVYNGGWRVPAQIYKDWYYKTYDIEKEISKRALWLSGIKMAMSWADSNTDVLDAMAKHVDPHKVVIHMSNWRDFTYDQNYPDYSPSAAAVKYIEHGAKLGFKIAPHMNAMEIDPSHEVYPMFSDFLMTDIDRKTVYGWGWDNGRYLGVPWTEYARTDPRNRPYNIMTKIHTGLSMWHSELYKRLREVAEKYSVAACFIDVTLCTYNLHNAIVEGRTTMEGINDLIKLLGEIRGGLTIGGEGLNEITAQGLSFAQMHLYRNTHHSMPDLDRCGGDCAINDFILGGLCKTIGYAGLSGRNEEEYIRLKIYDDHNTIPTIITNNPNDILNPNKFIKGVFDRANGRV
ncbi:MAG: DUF6259 domain-containing protein [Oscillospiraceae bacterium]|nr:DUF6259 domain-containing protein [Oscillospiraceae bacterium]